MFVAKASLYLKEDVCKEMTLFIKQWQGWRLTLIQTTWDLFDYL